MSSAHLPGPASAAIIDIAIAELCIYAALFIPALWITWKHGKVGMSCWTIFLSLFALRFVSDIFQIVQRNSPRVPGTVLIVTQAGTLACLSMTFIGLVHEANNILPVSGKAWGRKIVFAFTHLTNTTGIALATYAGSPTRTGGVLDPTLNKTGNLLMVLVMLVVCAWIWPSWQRINSFSSHNNFRNARWLLLAASAGMPFQLTRLFYNTAYAFDRVPSLDPIMGSFANQFALLFLMHLAVVLTAITGGWLSRHIMDTKLINDDGLTSAATLEMRKDC